MKITLDTNVLIRSVVRDNKNQASAADRVMKQAEVIAITLPCLCEFVWVLSSLYGLSKQDITMAIRVLIDARSVETERQSVEAGLAVLEAGGDFADGVIAHEGARLGGDTFISFDKQTIKLLSSAGLRAQLP